MHPQKAGWCKTWNSEKQRAVFCLSNGANWNQKALWWHEWQVSQNFLIGSFHCTCITSRLPAWKEWILLLAHDTWAKQQEPVKEKKKKKRNRELSSFSKNVTLILAALVLWYNLENIGCLVEVMLRCIHLIQLVCISQWWGKKSTELNAPAIIKTQTRQYK